MSREILPPVELSPGTTCSIGESHRKFLEEQAQLRAERRELEEANLYKKASTSPQAERQHRLRAENRARQAALAQRLQILKENISKKNP